MREPAPSLEVPAATDRTGILTELKAGQCRNFFVVHDGDGSVQVYEDLARHLPEDLAVIGISPSRIANVPLAHTRIEKIAKGYVKQLLKRQAHGPYLLGGLCAGGVIAYEMSLQLLDAGEVVETVILFDAATPQATRISEQRIRRLKRALARAVSGNDSIAGRAYSVLGTLWQKLGSTLAWRLMYHSERGWARLRFCLLHRLLAQQIPWPRHLPALSVREIYESAEAYYVPKWMDYGTSVVLVRARHRTPTLDDMPYRAIYSDKTFGWSVVAKDLKIVDADGGHATMLREPFAGSLAAKLLTHINQGLRSDLPKVLA